MNEKIYEVLVHGDTFTCYGWLNLEKEIMSFLNAGMKLDDIEVFEKKQINIEITSLELGEFEEG